MVGGTGVEVCEASEASQAKPTPSPSTNRGYGLMLNPCNSSIQLGPISKVFDWYRAAVPVPVEEFMTAAQSDLFPLCDFAAVDLPPVRFMGAGKAFVDAEDCRLIAVYQNPDNFERCNVIASGYFTDAAVKVIRSFDHRPSRVDVCLDLASPGLFDDLSPWSVRFAANHRLHRSMIINDDPDLGHTIYLGQRTSPTFVRIYQPGLLRAKNEGRTGSDIFDLERSAVRVELEVKPANPADKLRASTLDGPGFWGWSKWTSLLYTHLTRLEVDRVQVSKPRESLRDAALRHMCAQYERHLVSLMAEHHGDLAAFGADLFARLPQKARAA